MMNFRGVPFIEPVYGGLTRCAGAECHGLLLKLTKKSFARLIMTEGVSKGYMPIEVEVKAYDGRIIKAYALSPHYQLIVHGQYPSKRYRNLLIQGAQEHGLSIEYQNYLKTIPTNNFPLVIGIPFLIILLVTSFPTNIMTALALIIRSLHLAIRRYLGKPSGRSKIEESKPPENSRRREANPLMKTSGYTDFIEQSFSHKFVHWSLYYFLRQVWMMHGIFTLRSFFATPAPSHLPFYKKRSGN